MGLIRTFLTFGNKSSSNLNVQTLIRHCVPKDILVGGLRWIGALCLSLLLILLNSTLRSEHLRHTLLKDMKS